MSAPVSHLTKLPVEVLEQIFLHLPGQDVIKVEAVRGVVFNSVQCGLDSLSYARSADTSGIFFAIRPSFSTDASSSLLV